MTNINIDLVILIITICLLGIRYPHYVLIAAFINLFGYLLAAIIFSTKVNLIVFGGIFNSFSFSNLSFIETAGLFLSGPFLNFLIASVLNDKPEKTQQSLAFVIPYATLRNPLKTINMRFAFVTFLYNIGLLLNVSLF
ncbi:hypothetical protein LJC10_04540 [Selenomonadales bacterium OttesenSCG-928-I06]|nr:hypothetical protein [Selenomonadales bacterium OttesenSCG-928-I06]